MLCALPFKPINLFRSTILHTTRGFFRRGASLSIGLFHKARRFTIYALETQHVEGLSEMAQLDNLSTGLSDLAERECRNSSPLYERLSLGIAADPAILAIASHAREGQPVPNLFLGAAHLLLLKGAQHIVSTFYPSVSKTPAPDEKPPILTSESFAFSTAARLSN